MGIVRKLKLLRCKCIIFTKRRITIGKNSTFGRGTVFYAPQKSIIGNNVYIGKYCSIETNCEIEDDVVIGNNVGIIGKYDHDYSCIEKSIRFAPWIGDEEYSFKGKNAKIVIENDVWIGYGSILLGNITIGHGAIVAAGSVVTKCVEPYSIVAGNPAKEVGKRFSHAEAEQHEKFLMKR